MTLDELQFFDPAPRLLPIYEALRAALLSRYPEMRIKVSRTQLSFYSRCMFAMVSLPRTRAKDFLLLSFGLPARLNSPRVSVVVEVRPNRQTHHLPLRSPEEIDAELLGFLDEAHAFAQFK